MTRQVQASPGKPRQVHGLGKRNPGDQGYLLLGLGWASLGEWAGGRKSVRGKSRQVKIFKGLTKNSMEMLIFDKNQDLDFCKNQHCKTKKSRCAS